jgi:hypothetical protein
VKKAVSQYAEEIANFDPEEWLAAMDTVALINDNDDIALFERQQHNPISVYGHYFFWSRGKEARKAAKEFLKEAFTGDYGIEIILGLTPVTNKGALWMNRQLGFRELETIPTFIGDVRFVQLTKKEWEQQ